MLPVFIKINLLLFCFFVLDTENDTYSNRIVVTPVTRWLVSMQNKKNKIKCFVLNRIHSHIHNMVFSRKVCLFPFQLILFFDIYYLTFYTPRRSKEFGMIFGSFFLFILVSHRTQRNISKRIRTLYFHRFNFFW